MRYTKSILLAVLAIALLATQSFGETKRLGTAGAQELRIPTSAREMALGCADITTVSGAEAMFWNPAGMSNVSTYEAMFSHLNYIADINFNVAGLAYNTGTSGVIGVSARVLNIGEFEETTELQPDGTGFMIDPTFLTLGLSYANGMTDRVSIGAGVNMVSEKVDRMSALGIGFDFGVNYKVTEEFLFGIVVKNLGPEIKWDGTNANHSFQYGGNPNSAARNFRTVFASHNLPTSIQFGLAYQYMVNQDNRIAVYPAFTSNNFSEDEFNFGAEYSYKDMLFIRGGYKYADQEDWLWGPSFGGGIKYSNITVDYTYGKLAEDYFEDNHWLTVKLGM